MKKIKEKLIKITPYWMAHAYVAIIISLITGYWAGGSLFYLGRELRDWEKLHDYHLAGFDWKGLLAPIVASLILYFLGV